MVKKLLEENEIDVLCMQETEIMNDINHNELNMSRYRLEIEQNDTKARVGFFMPINLSYARRTDLEGINSNLIIYQMITFDKSKFCWLK